jgi:hypothetical protein
MDAAPDDELSFTIFDVARAKDKKKIARASVSVGTSQFFFPLLFTCQKICNAFFSSEIFTK